MEAIGGAVGYTQFLIEKILLELKKTVQYVNLFTLRAIKLRGV